ncbi:MAG: hypothetical protein ACXVRK_14150, partial [Gaiellaceae bacterium]
HRRGRERRREVRAGAVRGEAPNDVGLIARRAAPSAAVAVDLTPVGMSAGIVVRMGRPHASDYPQVRGVAVPEGAKAGAS